MAAATPRRPKSRKRRALRSIKSGVINVVGEDTFYRTRDRSRLMGSEVSGKQLMIIHQMGKVGSTTIARALKASPLRDTTVIYQTHFLSEEGLAFVNRLNLEGYGSWEAMPLHPRRGYIKGQLLHDHLGKLRRDGRRVQVISLVRDPVAANVSGFFQQHEWWPAELREQCADGGAACVDALVQRFNAWYPHDFPLNWFDMEMQPVFGIDVYTTEFPKETGYKVYRGDFADLLLIKLEKLDDCVEDAFGEFLQLDHFRPANSNRATDKWYSDLYAAFKRSLVLSDAYLDHIYGSRFAHHFYTDAELAAFHRAWQRQPESVV